MKFFKSLVWKVLAVLNFDAAVRLFRSSALVDEGWYESYRTKQSINKGGEPIPWYTYSFIHFIEPRLKPEFRVFEYGCGNSTIWYARRVKGIVAVEHDIQWAAKVTAILPANARAILKDPNEGYVQEIDQHGLFDIVVIDGVKRVECAPAALGHLKVDGVVVWDNSDLEKYSEGLKLFTDHGFREIAFNGMGPINTYSWRTSILYRTNNCLGI
ncbi:MAG: FkbM family methyltransferase [Anaerolineae bacterium]